MGRAGLQHGRRGDVGTREGREDTYGLPRRARGQGVFHQAVGHHADDRRIDFCLVALRLQGRAGPVATNGRSVGLGHLGQRNQDAFQRGQRERQGVLVVAVQRLPASDFYQSAGQQSDDRLQNAPERFGRARL